MTKLNFITLVLVASITSSVIGEQKREKIPSTPVLTRSEVEQLLRTLMTEEANLKLVEEEELGTLRNNAYVLNDFNADGSLDIAIAAVAEHLLADSPGLRDGTIIVATKMGSQWKTVYTHQLPGTRFPFVVWDAKNRALLLGAAQSDADQGEIRWDTVKKKYRYVTPEPDKDGY